MLSKTCSTWVTSCRLAPVTTMASGVPRPSTKRCRLLPFFSPVGRVSPNRLLCQRCLGHGPIDALPLPGNSFEVVILGEACLPKFGEEASPSPFQEIGMNGAGTAECLFR